MALKAKQITLGYKNTIVLDDINVVIPKGKVTMLVGSNGCGKSTFLKAMARLLRPLQGSMEVNGLDVFLSPSKKVARQLSILTQNREIISELTVFNLVKQGRYPHQSFLQQYSKQDEAIIHDALKKTGTYEIKDKKLNELSGGQLQRAWIALTLAQDTDVLLLDEPTNHLDLKYKIEILDLLKDLNKQEQRTIVVVLHDINLACRYADYIISLKDGNINAQGDPKEIVTESFIKEVFDMDSVVIEDPIHKTPLVIAY